MTVGKAAFVTGRLAQVRPRGLLGVLPLVVFLVVRQGIGPDAAIVSGFATSLGVFLVNRGHAGPVLALSTYALATAGLASVAALWWRDERIYFMSDPIWDFSIALLLLGSAIARRPLAGPVTHDLVPSLVEQLQPKHRVFYVATMLAAGTYLAHGFVRISLLIRTESLEQYLVFSRAMQWPSALLVLLVIAWLIRRSAREHGAAAVG